MAFLGGELSPLILRYIKEKRMLLSGIIVVKGVEIFIWLSSYGFVNGRSLS